MGSVGLICKSPVVLYIYFHKIRMIELRSAMVLTIISSAMGEEMPCKFTGDCEQYQLCQNIQDASCVCNFGSCVISGGFWWGGRDSECDSYEDCSCKNNRDECFCRSGRCVTEKWECHDSPDCVKMKKCSNGQCSCSGNTCESECTTVSDCTHYCSSATGYKCKCENFLCGFEKVNECRATQDCLDKELCSSDKPCDCVNEDCVAPWWVLDDQRNCRTDQDCEAIADCQESKCSCNNVKPLFDSGWDKRGKCEKRGTPTTYTNNLKNNLVFSN